LARASIALTFSPDIHPANRSRILYALRVFAAIYDYRITDRNESADYRCRYGLRNSVPSAGECLDIPARYEPLRTDSPLPMLQPHPFAGEQFHLAFGVDPSTNRPDWLGEIFHWISSSMEAPIKKRDSAGRIPYSEMVFARQGISATRAHASALMAWFDHALQNKLQETLTRAPAPIAGVKHLVICSHDIDFQFTTRPAAVRRLLKNLAVAAIPYRSISFFAANTKMLLGLFRDGRPGDYLRPMIDALEEKGVKSTLFAVANKGHRRDPEYDLSEISPLLAGSGLRGFPVGAHGSYRSIIEDASVPNEVAVLHQSLGVRPKGGRQHWLRFDEHHRLFREIERSKLVYDSTLGFAETCGFRNGASFAFPPYDFASETAHSFLEIPLAIMDGALALSVLRSGRNPQAVANEILAESRRWGWGGIAILWHNPMQPVQVPEEINRVFWDCAERRGGFAEEWVSAEEFVRVALPRYQQAGLLTEVSLDA